MNANPTVSDAMRLRLRLSLGTLADLGEELPAPPGHRAFAGVDRADNLPVVITVHATQPVGPDPEAFSHRVKQLRQLNHGLLDLPLAVGDLDGRAWVMEATSGDTLARERLHSGPLSLTHAVSATRDLARALAAVHRRQLVHGAIGLDSVRITSDGARLGGVGRSLEGSVRGDLDALGEVMWALFSGEVEGGSLQPLSKVRRGVTPTLDALFASMRAPDPRDRPQRAEAILSALDAVPTRRRNPLASIVDVGLHDARPRRAVVWLVVGAAVLLLAALLQSRS